MKKTVWFICLAFFACAFLSPATTIVEKAQSLPCNGERILKLDSLFEGVHIWVHLPSAERLKKDAPTTLLLYALPNGNSIEWTAGKKTEEADDWHFDIQHVAAQTRFLWNELPDRNLFTVYLMAENRSWPAWVSGNPASGATVQKVIDTLRTLFSDYQPDVYLNGHSGGGRFILEYIAQADSIPDYIRRIGFLDSNYAYTDSLHRQKLIDWLYRKPAHHLSVIAYNDSVVIYNGKPLVSPPGGTWYRSRKMQRDFSPYVNMSTLEDTAFIYHRAMDGRLQFALKKNPRAEIYHTVLVEKNGLIHSVLSGSEKEEDKYTFWGPRAYDSFICSTLFY